jgi:hypothetical protein
MHHDKQFAVHRNGVSDIFLNSPTQAAWFERYISDWCGPKARLERLFFKMKKSIFPQDEMIFKGVVSAVTMVSENNFTWVELELSICVEEQLATECKARVAVPNSSADSPWRCDEHSWQLASMRK